MESAPPSRKGERLQYLCDCLGLNPSDVDNFRYQLLHRTASALIEAEKFNVSHALTMIHLFSQTDEGFDDFEQFVALFGAKVEVDSIVRIPRRRTLRSRFNETNLYIGWVRDQGQRSPQSS